MDGQSTGDMDAESETEPASSQATQDRIEELEQRLECLENTLRAVTNNIDGLSLSGRCVSCKKCLQVIEDGTMYCPRCGDGQSL